MRLGVVADDLTGANDIGIMFAKAGFPTEIYTFAPGSPQLAARVANSQAAVVILNTNARLLPPGAAYQQAYQATRLLQACGCRQYYNKTCSVFRGPVGAYFDGMLAALQQNFALVVLGFPKNGRTTLNGIHYVHGQKLEDSEFRHDPIHPMLHSNLVEILQSQTSRRVMRLEQPLTRTEIASAATQCSYLILDVADQADLRKIALTAADVPVFCGSSALAEELALVWDASLTPSTTQVTLPESQPQGILTAAGSLMPQTRAQMDYLRSRGLPVVEFDSGAIFDPHLRAEAVTSSVGHLAHLISSGQDAGFHMPQDPQMVKQIQSQGAQSGLSLAETGALISTILAEVVYQIIQQTGLNRLVVAGGETSAAVCDRLGLHGFRVWKEIEPGLPSCISLSTPPMLLVLKSGSFGGTEFLYKAIQHLRQETETRHE